MSKITQIPLLGILIAVFLLSGCRKEDDLSKLTSTDWNPEMAIPLFDERVEFQDILEQLGDSIGITTDPDNVIHFSFNQDLFEMATSDLVEIPDTALPLPPFLDSASITFPIGNGIRLEQMDIVSGFFDVLAYSSEASDIDLTVRLPFISDNSLVFELNGIIPGNSSNTLTKDMSGFRWDLSELMTTSNGITVEYDAIRTSDQQKVFLDSIFITFRALEYSYLEGYFGVIELDTVAGAEDIGLDVGFLDGLTLVEPVLTLILDNSIGLPINIQIDSLVGSNGSTVVPLTGSMIGGPTAINYPTLTQVGQSISTDIEINSGNSNIANLMSINPNKMSFNVFGAANPAGDSTITNFITDSSMISARIDADIPLNCTISDFTVSDTIEFDFSILEAAKSASLKIVTENTLPADILFQLVFLDSLGNAIDSIFDQPELLLVGGTPDPDGIVRTAANNEIFVTMDEATMAKAQGATQLMFSANLTTVSNGTVPVKFTADGGFNFRMGMIIKLDVSGLGGGEDE